MTTWRMFDQGAGTGTESAVSSWRYDPYRGWLAGKGYADPGSGVATTNGPVVWISGHRRRWLSLEQSGRSGCGHEALDVLLSPLSKA
jgi:hypothetical protein